MLCALLLCAGLILTSCEEFPFFDGENSEQNGNGNTGGENVGGENTGDNEYAGSSDGAANCYIISEVGLYKFKTVRQ